MTASMPPDDEDGIWRGEGVRASYDKLSPKIQQMFQAMRAECAREEVVLMLIDGWRSHERQIELQGQRIHRTGEPVTCFPPGTSFHEYGLAFDCCVWKTDGTWIYRHDDPAHLEVMAHVAEIAGRLTPLKWGGEWKEFVDPPHFYVPIEWAIAEAVNDTRAEIAKWFETKADLLGDESLGAPAATTKAIVAQHRSDAKFLRSLKEPTT